MTEIKSAVLQLGIDTTKAKQGRDEFGRYTAAVKNDARSVSGELTNMEKSANSAGAAADKLTSYIRNLAGSLLALYGANKTVTLLRDYDAALIGLGKTADLQGAELDKLGDRFVNLSTKVPVTAKALLDTAAVAAQLGVEGAENIERFTLVVAKLGTATNLKGEEGATALARLLNVTGEGVGNVERLGNVIARMDVAAAATASEIAHIATEVAKATSIFKTSTTDAVGLSAAMASVGIQAEIGGSSIGRLMRSLDAAARGDVEKLGQVLKITGQDAKSFGEEFRQSPIDSILRFLKALGEFQRAGGDVTKVLENMELAGEQNAKVIPTLAVNFELLAKSVAAARDEAEDMTALNKNFDQYSESVNARLSVLGNTIDAIILKIRTSRGALSDAIKYLTDVIAVVGGVTDEADKMSPAVQAGAIAVEALTLAAGTFVLVKFGPTMLEASKAAVMLTSTSTALTTTLKLLTIAAAAGAVAFGAWELGSWSYEQLDAVQDFTVGATNYINDMWSFIRYAYDNGTAAVLAALASIGEATTHMAATAVSTYATAMRAIGKTGAADDADKYATELTNSAYGIDLNRISTRPIVNALAKDLEAETASLLHNPETQRAGENLRAALKGIVDYMVATPDDTGTDFETRFFGPVFEQFSSKLKEFEDLGGAEARAAAYSIRKTLADELSKADLAQFNSKSILADLQYRVRQYENEQIAKQLVKDIGIDRNNGDLNNGQTLTDKFKGDLDAIRKYLLGIEDAAGAAGDAGQEAGNKAAEAAEEAAKATAAQTTAVLTLTDAQKKAAAGAGEIFDSIRRTTMEYRRFNIEGVEAARQAAALDEKLRNAGLKFGGPDAAFDVEKYITEGRQAGLTDQQIRDNLQGLLEIEQAAEEAAERIAEVAETIGDSFGDQFERMVFDGMSWRDAMEGFAMDVARAVFRASFTDPLVDMVTQGSGNILTALGFARGGMFNGGNEIQPMARGDIIYGPTMRSMSNGRDALLGESGPETVLKMYRGSDGVLGVKGQISGGATNIQNINVFPREQSQIRPTKRQMQAQVLDLQRGSRS